MRTALITGARGFLGQHTMRDLAANGWEVVGVDRQSPAPGVVPHPGQACHVIDLPSAEFGIVLASVQPDLIVHAAGPASVPGSMSDPESDFRGSVEVLFEVLDSVRRFSPASRVLFISSAAVYGNPSELPVREDAARLPVSAYGFHRVICEMLVEEFHSLYGVRGCSVRIFSAYGPGLQRQVLWDICQKAVHQSPVQLLGTGDETRDFIHANDIARAIGIVGDKARFESEAYNLASGVETKIADLAWMLVEALGAKTHISFSGVVRPGDPLRWCADVGRLAALGFRPSVSMEQGVSEYASWFLGVLGVG